MRRRKPGPVVGAERLSLRERRGILDSRVRGNDMGLRERALHPPTISYLGLGRQCAVGIRLPR
jgi:hypothetical protein